MVAKLGYLHMCIIKDYTDKNFFQDLRAEYRLQKGSKVALKSKLKRIDFVKVSVRFLSFRFAF